MHYRFVSATRAYTNRALRLLSLAIAVVLLGNVALPAAVMAAEVGDTTDGSATVTTTEVLETLQDVPGILGASDQVVAGSDADSAVVATTAGTLVDVPKDPEQGVTFGAANGPKIEVELPNAASAGDGKQVAPGVVAYSSGDGSANAVQASEDGSVRMLTIIDNPNAPTEYDYKVNVPNGGVVQVIEGGSALVLGVNGELISAVGAPWAKDAEGKAVNTWFTTDGQTLTQHVQHNVPGVVYPVTADPVWIPALVGAALGAAN